MMAASADGTFADFIASLGYEPPARIEPGRWTTFSANGKRNNTAGRCKLFPDGEGGIVYDWRSGECQVWQARRQTERTPEAAQRWREKIERDRREAAAERERAAEETKKRAGELLAQSQPADDSHPYLVAKGVKCHGARIYRGPLALREMKCDGALMIPRRDLAGNVVSLQFIAPSGEKRYLAGPIPTGSYFAIGKPNGVVCIAEGFATGATIHEATGHAVAVAFEAGNVEATAKAIRAKFPDARLILCADDDWKTQRPNGAPWNPGMEAATAAARAVGGVVAVPTFGPDRGDSDTDFNDSARALGPKAVVEALGAARPVESMSQDQPTKENGSKAPSGGFVGSGEWPEPQALPDGLPAVKPFEPEWLPDKLRPWVADIGDRLQCPLDFVAVALMVSLGSVIGRRVGIRPQERTDWTEYANLWGCIVGRPSLMKSPAMERGLDPLRALAHKAVKAFEAEQLAYEAKMTAHKVRRDLASDEMKRRLKGNILADVRDLQIPEPEEPQMRRYLTNDTSYEKLGDLHRANPNGLLVFRDELVSLLKGLDREDNAGARGFYLTGWSGNSPYVFDRMTREGAAIDAICLSVLGSTQPSRLAEYVRAAVKGGAGDDGLMQRFGLLVWPDTSSEWKDIDRWPDSDASREAFDVFERMSALDPSTIGAHQDTDRNTGELRGQPYLRLTPEALAIFREWREAWERKCRSGSELPALESHFTKYRKLVPALALISHLADGTGGDVGSVAMLRALAWAEYLEPHARRAYASLDAPEQAAAKAIIDRLRKGDLAAEFKARDIYRKGWAHLTDPELVHNALRLLADFDWLAVREVSAKETGGSPARIYIANPRGLK
jgi:putative DNA primase/helicase